MPLISVIVPVYQAQALLEACVDSVRAQTFSDWELLLVDDGSTDGSPALCDRFAAADRRIRVFHQKNGGVSAARNTGLSHIRAGAVAFLDADDALEPRALEILWQLRKTHGADTAGCAHFNVTPEGSASQELLLPQGVYHSAAIKERIVVPLLGQRLAQPVFNGFIWRYLFSAELLEGMRFEGAYLEDELFLLEYFCRAQCLAVTEEPLYRYLLNPTSATHRFMPDLNRVFARYMERKECLARRFDLEGLCPTWRDNSNWAGLLIAVGNEFAPGSPKTMVQRKEAIRALCARPEMARAIRSLRPAGLGRRKQLVAALIRGGHFTLLTLLYRLKNHL